MLDSGCAGGYVKCVMTTEPPATESQPRHKVSECLTELLAAGDGGNLTLNGLMERISGQGVYILILLLSLPFVTPIPLPGVSTIFGLAISFLALRLAFGLPARLPSFIGNRPLSQKRFRAVIGGTAKLMRVLEKFAKPRQSRWMEFVGVRIFNLSVIALMGLLLALPLPPILPFSNSLPSWAIIFVALAVMEGDGVLIWFAYILAAGCLIYLGAFAGLIMAALRRVFDFS